MAHLLPRGIAPELLFSQVKNTMPYLFEGEIHGTPLERFPPAVILRDFESQMTKPLDHFEYFRLCLSSHYLTCGTPVPTDVDNQIRHKLWPKQLPLEIALQMVQLVLESRKWDFTKVSTRYTRGAQNTPWNEEVLSGHLGEWFTLAAAAYCALKQYASPIALEKSQELFDQIADEVRRHSEIFGSLWRAHEGLACLKTAASIAHNFGDLDRVMDMWELSVADPLRLEFYKLTALPFDSHRKLRYLGRLWVAGELYKANIDGSSMAFENHRHFALRKPKCLRKSPELLIPIGPFFDQWGKTVAMAFKDVRNEPSESTFEVVEALVQGWKRLPNTVGYGRALRGILEVHSGLSVKDSVQGHRFRATLNTSQEQFEKKWNNEALRQMDDIPSRA